MFKYSNNVLLSLAVTSAVAPGVAKSGGTDMADGWINTKVKSTAAELARNGRGVKSVDSNSLTI